MVEANEYHPQMRKKMKRFNKTVIARLQHYFDKRETDWNLHMQPIVYGYYMQMHRTT